MEKKIRMMKNGPRGKKLRLYKRKIWLQFDGENSDLLVSNI